MREEALLEPTADRARATLEREEPSLSPRELEIARMVAAGHPNKTIAAVLDISMWTVATHLRRIFAKLHVTSRAAMLAKLMEAKALK
jgi:DNA-binding CsgD family transcriptional regulator